MAENESIIWIKDRIHDKKHFTARYLASLSDASGMDPELLAKVAVGTYALILAACHQAHFFGNLVLVVVPFLLIFVHPDEKPTDESLLVYFSTFGLVTLFDRNLETVPCYYILKLALFLLLFIPPYRLVDKIEELIKNQLKNDDDPDKKSRKTTKSKSRKSMTSVIPKSEAPPPAPPAEAPPPPPPAPAPQEAAPPPPPPPPADPAPAPPPPAAEPAPTPAPVSPAPTSEEPRGEPVQRPEHLPMSAKSVTDVAPERSQRLKVGINPMQSSSFHRLNTESEGINSNVIGPANNLNDFITFPTSRIVFNAPFDYENLTYHIKVINNSHHRIAYAVKGNAVPRVMVNPPFGVLNSKEIRLIAVTCQKFYWNPTDYEKDRIAFDYVILPDTSTEKEFSMKMFQYSDAKRRKNLRVVYNP